MANNQEQFELILKTAGEEKVAQLQASAAAAERELEDLIAASSLLGQAVPTAELAQYAQKIADLKNQLARAESYVALFGAAERKAASDAAAAAAKVVAAEDAKQQAALDAMQSLVSSSNQAAAANARVGASAVAVGSQARSGSVGVMQLARAIDDTKQFSQGFAAGMMAIGNNIQGVLEGFKATATLAPYVAIAGTAVTLVATKWSDLVRIVGYGQFQPAVDGLDKMEAELKKATETMDELGKVSNLTFSELQKFNDAKVKVQVLTEQIKDAKTVKDAGEQKSQSEKDIGEGFGKAIAESGGKSAISGYKDALNDSKDAKGQVFNFKQDKLTGVDDAARDNLAAALGGDKRARDDIAKTMPGSILADNIKKFSPEQEKADKEAKEEKELDQKEKEAAADALNAAEKARVDKEYQAFLDEEKAIAEDEKARIKEEADYQSKLSQWAFQEQQRIDQENEAAQVQDALKARNEGRDRTSQVIAGSASLHDSIQGSIKSDRDKTAVEQLEELRDIHATLKKEAENKQTIVARLG